MNSVGSENDLAHVWMSEYVPGMYFVVGGAF